MLLNFILFQTIWFGCIYIGNSFVPVGALLIAFHFYKTHFLKEDVVIIALCIVTGLVLDSLVMAYGVFSFNHGIVIDFLIPPWLVLIWAAFGMTLNHSLAYFQQKPLLAFVGGSISGPLSYLAGARLGAIETPYDFWWTFLIFSIIWGPVFMLLSQCSKKLNEKFDSNFTVKNEA
ncbi:DUF2878 domain-containing protein [Psychrosphaera aestuarii]|uniref:DUF2878 domain-containing protein n=1 Tax=Psychrosphaera aestuarii TaxID=1266052 RepID=UPI001B31CF79|nr:DUF2878 domain-containing protein [Psychrosphaera aestuarii]